MFAGPAESVCATIMQELVGSDPPVDDIALLVLRRHPVPEADGDTLELELPAAPSSLKPLRIAMRRWLEHIRADRQATADLLTAVGEACSNAIEHAGTDAGATIDIRARMIERELLVTVGDRGVWRTASAPVDRGHGLRLMRVLSSTMRVATSEGGTRVELRFRLGEGTAAEAESAPADPALELRRIDEVPVARLRGEVDRGRKEQLARALAAAVKPPDRGLVLDLSAVEYLDSAGVHLLHELMLALDERGQSLRVVARPGAPVLRVLALVDLERRVPLDSSVDEAVAALTPPGRDV
jgi:anti-anti-sigma factor